jgi:hypothetical protein
LRLNADITVSHLKGLVSGVRLKGWYMVLLLGWALLALPGFIGGWAYAGHAPWRDIPLMFEPELFDPSAVAFQLLLWAFLLSPFALAPFGIARRSRD